MATFERDARGYPGVQPASLAGRGLTRGLRLVLAASILVAFRALGQEDDPSWRIGAEFGTGKQQFHPIFHDYSYRHDVTGYKFLLNRRLSPFGTFGWELQIEPSFYAAHQQLLNPYDTSPTTRARYTSGEVVREYVVNPGILGRYNPTPRFSLFFLLSVGPAWIDTATERLAKGFAFSDILAGGVGLRFGRALVEFRPGLRHVSNLYTQKPNHGYNSGTFDLALSIYL